MDYLVFKELYHSELQHHGIKGQKWGIRRFQNEDGTLTEEGKLRYRKNLSDKNLTDDDIVKTINKAAKSNSKIKADLENVKEYGKQRMSLYSDYDRRVNKELNKYNDEFYHPSAEEFNANRSKYNALYNKWQRSIYDRALTLLKDPSINKIADKFKENNKNYHNAKNSLIDDMIGSNNTSDDTSGRIRLKMDIALNKFIDSDPIKVHMVWPNTYDDIKMLQMHESVEQIFGLTYIDYNKKR